VTALTLATDLNNMKELSIQCLSNGNVMRQQLQLDD